MDDLYNKIVADRGTLENLASKIPGFKGYMEMSARRDADSMMRNNVAKQYETQLNRMATIESDIVRGGGLAYMDKSKTVRTKLENLRRRIATDTPGYSGFFAKVKIGPEELQSVYAFDEAMVRYAEEVSSGLDGLANAVSANDGIEAALSDMERILTEAHQAYDLRDNVLNNIE